jgi:hypothetical protein
MEFEAPANRKDILGQTGIIDDSEPIEVQVSAVVLADHERVATGGRGEGNAVQVHDLVKLDNPDAGCV